MPPSMELRARGLQDLLAGNSSEEVAAPPRLVAIVRAALPPSLELRELFGVAAPPSLVLKLNEKIVRGCREVP